jgi:hypothetical protein
VNLQVRVSWTRDVSDLDTVKKLAPFHLWQHSELEKRFHYEEEKGRSGLSIAFVRVAKLSAPFIFPDSPKYGGCRSWIQLPELPPEISASPVLDDAAHAAREAEVLAALA